MPETPFNIGDLVYHQRIDAEENDPRDIGEVIGTCPGPRWIRVKTCDGRRRIWLKDHVHNVDFEMKEGNYLTEEKRAYGNSR